jgi:hypothetical protein
VKHWPGCYFQIEICTLTNLTGSKPVLLTYCQFNSPHLISQALSDFHTFIYTLKQSKNENCLSFRLPIFHYSLKQPPDVNCCSIRLPFCHFFLWNNQPKDEYWFIEKKNKVVCSQLNLPLASDLYAKMQHKEIHWNDKQSIFIPVSYPNRNCPSLDWWI